MFPATGGNELPEEERTKEVPIADLIAQQEADEARRELQARPAEDPPKPASQANDQGPVIVPDGSVGTPLAPMSKESSGKGKRRHRGHRSEKIHTNPGGWKKAELDAVRADSPPDDEQPPLTMPSPMSVPAEPQAPAASLPRPPGYTTVPPSASSNPSTEPPDASEVRPKHELNETAQGADQTANGPAKAEGK